MEKLESGSILDQISPKVLPIISEANKIFLEGFNTGSGIKWKEGGQLSTSALTETDLKLDQFLREQLRAAFPDTGLITEEREDGPQGEYTFIIDPLDGTANFGNKIPITGISVALWEGVHPLYGVLSFPTEDQVVYAALGEGIFLNGEELSRPALEAPPHLSSLFTGVGSERFKLEVVNRMVGEVPFPNNFQSAAFHFKTLALRRADLGVFINMPLWDIAAGVVITSEAGLSNIYLPETVSAEVNLRQTRYSLVVGNREITSKVAVRIKN